MNLIEQFIVARATQLHDEIGLDVGPVNSAAWRIVVWGHRQVTPYPDLRPLLDALKPRE
jgi:hypothetical protein